MLTKTKALVAGGVAAAALATGGGIAYAATSSPSTPAPAPSGSTAAKSHDHHRHGGRLPGLAAIEHGQFVTKDKAGTQVTHDVATGTVTAVSANSIAVKDASGQTDTFTVDAKTRVHVKGQAKGTKSTIADVKTGMTASLVGTGTGPFTATFVDAH